MMQKLAIVRGALLLAAGFAWAGEPQPPAPSLDQPAVQPPAREWAVTPCLPADTVFVITVKDMEKAMAAFSKTGLAQVINSPELTQVIAGPLLLAKGTLWMLEQRHGYKLNDILASLQGEMTIAFMGLQEIHNEKGEKIPDLLISLQPRGHADRTMQLVNQLVGNLNTMAMGQLLVQQSMMADAKITTLSLPDNPLKVCYTFWKGTFMASLNPARLESVLAAQQAANADGPLAQGLGAHPVFLRTWTKVGQDADALVFFNVEAGRKIPEMNLAPKAEREKRAVEMAGLDQVRALSYSLAFKDENIQEMLFVDCPTEGRRGLMAMLDNEPIEADAIGTMPRNAVFASAWRVDPVQFLHRIIELVGAVNPGDPERIEHEIAKLNGELKIDFRKDLLAAFTGEILFSLAMPAKHPKLGLGFPQPIFRMGVKNTAAAEKALSIFRQMGKDTFNYTELGAGNRTITVARTQKPVGDDLLQICWVLADKQILMSIFPLALRDELQRIEASPATGAEPTSGLTADPQFKLVRSRLGPSHRMMFYMDVSAMATAFYNIYVPLAQLNPKIAPPNVDMNNLPPSDFLTRSLGGLLVGVNADAEGLTLESCSATGLWTTLVPMAAIGIRSADRRARARAEAAAGQPDGEAELAPGRQMLREINIRLMAYAQDHNGNFPAKLDELVPNYATAEEAQKAKRVQYLGKQAAPNRVVAHLALDNAERIPVLLQDGRVRMVHADRLAATLEAGLVEAPKPAAGAAEKPPVPPPDF